ncbi:hypothetical protein CDL12_16955 [Handroanthus impetiginosus]|uniref:C2H2-type domain-containing protein n=1 Tax=Handroanthus impetiginosus TaxID=429701 RepID=A0A2G9GYV6_9LAMI|nr:hypothetical protein CDL12_16955 [Handroanthus impetiginosus]
MASATTAADGGSLQLDSIPIVDLRLLSQSELYSLSLCSSSAFDPSRWDDVVIPKIDRSVFNESAGSRKQTYSRLRLAPPCSSSSATPRRRTPHVRPTAASFAGVNNNNSDPENAENAQIVSLLKQLFVTDINPEELVPVKVDYSQSLPAQQFSSLPSSAPSNVGHPGQKRKRGRPRKNEHIENKQESAMDVSVVDVDNAYGFSSLNEIFVRENVEDKDREVLNRDGVAVDLMALGTVEHPYREEIRRRTEGLGTEEELLEFLKGLHGQWGSRRKKKRIVDASEFGNALPIGWRLSLSVKKKNGHVWLCCRRYISPSGLHFVSCKGVSSYLLSLHGVHLTNPHTSSQYNEIVNDADKLTSATIAHQPDPAIKDDNSKENAVSHASLLACGPASGNNEMQALTNAGDSPEGRLGEILRCNKCNVTFSEKDELLRHQSSVHRRNRYKRGVRVTDGVIIKDGKYECQFCHKTFSERRQYTGHIGAHIRYEGKTAVESPAEFVDPRSACEFSVRDSMTEGSLKSNNVVEICNAAANNRLNICSPCNKDNENVGDLNEVNGYMRVAGAVEKNPCSVAEVLLPGDGYKNVHEDTHENGCAAEIIDDGSNLQGRRSGSCSALPPNDATCGVMNSGLIENSASVEKPEQSMASKSSLLHSNNHMEEFESFVNNELNCCTRNELKLDYQNFAVNGSVVDFLGNHGSQDKDLAVSVKQQSDFQYLPCKNTGTIDKTSTSGSVASKHDEDPNGRPPTSHNDKACVQDDVPDWIGKHRVDDKCSFRTCENDGSKANDDGLSRHEEMQTAIGSVFPSWNEQENVSKKSDTEALNCPLKESAVQNPSNSKLVALSGHESMHGSENKDDAVCGRKMEKPEFDDFQNFGNGESRDPFSGNDAGLNSSSITGSEKDRKLGVCSPFATTTDKQFLTEDSMIRILNDTLEEQKQQPSGDILLSRTGVSDFSDKEYTLNKIYSAPANPPKLNEIDNAGRHGLSLSFDNLQTEMCKDTNRVEQERFQADGFNIQSFHKTYGDQTNLSIRNANVPSDQKQGRSFGIDFHDSSLNSGTQELGSNFNLAQPGRDWNEPRAQKIDPSSQNLMAGFGSSSSLSGGGGGVTADGSLRTGNEIVFQGGFDVASAPQISSSSCFSSFGLTSDKGV